MKYIVQRLKAHVVKRRVRTRQANPRDGYRGRALDTAMACEGGRKLRKYCRHVRLKVFLQDLGYMPKQPGGIVYERVMSFWLESWEHNFHNLGHGRLKIHLQAAAEELAEQAKDGRDLRVFPLPFAATKLECRRWNWRSLEHDGGILADSLKKGTEYVYPAFDNVGLQVVLSWWPISGIVARIKYPHALVVHGVGQRQALFLHRGHHGSHSLCHNRKRLCQHLSSCHSLNNRGHQGHAFVRRDFGNEPSCPEAGDHFAQPQRGPEVHFDHSLLKKVDQRWDVRCQHLFSFAVLEQLTHAHRGNVAYVPSIVYKSGCN
mmetsp:Transcript_25471/g.66671  ORF Transcript_25471/g.66671 Transcript_25471/m.66671 type:complete len:317 (-) Transcript_25471:402-1352(-)